MQKLVYIFILGSTVCYGQDAAILSHTNNTTDLNNSSFIINAGLGYSAIQWEFSNWPINGAPNFYYISPVYSATLDYGINNLFSAGVGIAQQSLDYVYTRTNTALRIMAHYGGNDIFDIYSGLRIGASFWTGNPSLHQATITLGSDNTRMSIQALSGIRLFISGIVGLQVEAGLGTPYFLEGGITVRINAH